MDGTADNGLSAATRLVGLRQEHRDLDAAIDSLLAVAAPTSPPSNIAPNASSRLPDGPQPAYR